MRRITKLTSIAVLLTGLFLVSSCSSSRGMCKSKKKYYKQSQKCWNAKKQKMTRC